MAAFVFKNNYFEFNGEVKHQISGTSLGTKFAPTYAPIFMDKIETNFLDTQEFKLLVGFDASMLSLPGHMVKKNWKSSQKIMLTTNPTLNLPMNSTKKALLFWTIK